MNTQNIEYKNIILIVEDGIATIKVSRASKLNALNNATIEELRLAMYEVYKNTDIKGAIITGEGTKAFVAGADIAELEQLDELQATQYSRAGQEVFALIENSPKPMIAAVNGYALGGGCELSLACHLRVAVESAKFALPEVKLGTIPGFGGTQRLAQIIGKAKALEMIMTGDMVSAKEAKDFGLVNYITNSQVEMLEKAKEILQKVATSSGPVAVAMVIKAVNQVYSSKEAGYQAESEFFGYTASTEDFTEGMQAFLEKRKANFQSK